MRTTDPLHPGRKAFYVLLAVAFAAAIWLLLPYFVAFVLALVTVVVAWPLHTRLVRLLRDRHRLAAAATLMVLTLGVFVPLTGLVALMSHEIVRMSSELSTSMGQQTAVEALLARLDTEGVRGWSEYLTGNPTSFRTSADGMVKGALVAALGGAAGFAAGVVNVTATALIHTFIFYVAAGGMLVDGEAALARIKRLSPLDDHHEGRLFVVFAQFARNFVLASLVSCLVQGLVAAIGYRIAGLDRWAVYAILTGVLSVIPFVGIALIWVPLVIVLLAQGDVWQAVFLLIWSATLTGNADNVVRPLVIRGGIQIPAVLVFLGGFGGLAWFGLVGILLGPVILAFLLELLTIYEERYLVRPTPTDASG